MADVWILLGVTIVAAGGTALANRMTAAFRRLREALEREQRRRAADITFLDGFTRKLADVAEIVDAMDMVLHHVLDVLQAESVGIYVAEDSPGGTRLRGAACTGTFPAFGQAATVQDLMTRNPRQRAAHFTLETVSFGSGIVGGVAAGGKPVILPDMVGNGGEQLPRLVDCLVAAPMQVDGRVVGVVVAVNRREEGSRYVPHDADVLSALACQAALASNLVRVYAERSRQERMVLELQVGREVQQTLLPPPRPVWDRFRLAAYGKPALEVAGDYYDYVPIDDDRLLVIVADAAGKGVGACMLMAMCRSLAHVAAEHYAGMDAFLVEMNRFLFADTGAQRFVTLGAVLLDRRLHTCEYGCAGHTPLLLRRPDGITETVRSFGPALGMLPPAMVQTFNARTLPFAPGSQLLLFSDGITEAMDRDGREFGLARLEAMWRENSLQQDALTALIAERVRDFSGSQAQTDDQTMVVIASG